MAESEQRPARRRTGDLMIQNIPIGAKVKLNGGAIAEVTGNPEDGGWLIGRYLSCPDDPSKEGNEEPIFCTDVLEEVEE